MAWIHEYLVYVLLYSTVLEAPLLYEAFIREAFFFSAI